MTSTITETPRHILDFVEAVAKFAEKAERVEAATRGRGWGFNEGESAVYRGGATIDEVLDLRSIAEAGMMAGSVEACDKFLASISKRPGVVTCSEIAKFCAEAREIAES